MSAPLDEDFTMDEVAKSMKMSTRWVRAKVAEGAEHNRYGHKIRFSAEQVEKLKASHTVNPIKQGVTTGRKR